MQQYLVFIYEINKNVTYLMEQLFGTYEWSIRKKNGRFKEI